MSFFELVFTEDQSLWKSSKRKRQRLKEQWDLRWFGFRLPNKGQAGQADVG
ncbi:hypothetical protein [Dubosiella newyorkensis]|uniref:hypothetical protein n=1 Tax=Dubosiella newyorkensis TaxID=1862672 RepID=UPI003F667710